MTGYEYIRVQIDLDDLSQLNRFSQDGWRVVQVIPERQRPIMKALLERPLPEKVQ